MHCKLQPHLLSLSAAVFVSTASMRLRAIQRRMGTITIAVRNDVPAAMSADTQAAFPDDHVLPSDLAAPLVLHAGSSNSRRVQQQRRRQQQRVSGSNWLRVASEHAHCRAFESAAWPSLVLWRPAGMQFESQASTARANHGPAHARCWWCLVAAAATTCGVERRFGLLYSQDKEDVDEQCDEHGDWQHPENQIACILPSHDTRPDQEKDEG